MTSEIEGEKLDIEQVRSSIARRLGIDTGGDVQTWKAWNLSFKIYLMYLSLPKFSIF
ncbi:MAG: DUF4172 domain-containing protein [Candidatus Gastranaerophilaceae bacterium]|jgi:hypothetical protein